jgi:hypothetical protein
MAPGFFFVFILGHRVCTLYELDSRLCDCESPAILSDAAASLSFPCCLFLTHHVKIYNATLKASGLQNAQFDFGHIELTAVLGPSFAWVTGNPHKT